MSEVERAALTLLIQQAFPDLNWGEFDENYDDRLALYATVDRMDFNGSDGA